MGDLLKVLKEQKLVSDEKLALLDHNFSGIAKKLFRDQVRNAKVKNKKGNRYNLVTKQFAVTLHYYSPKAYNFVRQVLNLPHQDCIRSWIASCK